MKLIQSSINLVCLSALNLFIATTSKANVVGTDLQNFNTTTSGIDYVTIESSEVLELGIFNVGFFINDAVNSLPYFENEGETQSRVNINDTILTREFNFGIGILPGLEVGISFPNIMKQTIDESDTAHGSFKSTGNTSTRYAAKYHAYKNKNYGLALAASINTNRIKNNPYLGESQGPIYNVQIIVDTEILGFALAGNLGYRWRSSSDPLGESVIEPTANQIIASVGSSYLLTKIDTKVIAEIFGSRSLKSTNSEYMSRQASSLEGLLGLKHDLTNTLAIHGGWGTELIHGASSPDWRIYAGLNWTTGPVFKRKTNEQSMFKNITPKKTETFVLQSIQFKFDSNDEVLPGSLKIISDLVEYSKKPPLFKMMIINGHTDSIGSSSYNKKLSLERANTVKQLLVDSYGIDPKKIQTIGSGEDKPIASNGNFQGRQKNRRVEITLKR